jgi:hypothetical protein
MLVAHATLVHGLVHLDNGLGHVSITHNRARAISSAIIMVMTVTACLSLGIAI